MNTPEADEKYLTVVCPACGQAPGYKCVNMFNRKPIQVLGVDVSHLSRILEYREKVAK